MSQARRPARRCIQPAECAALLALLADDHPPMDDAVRVEVYESLRRPDGRQGRLCFAPPNAGLIPGGQPVPTGLADRDGVGQ